MTPEEKWQRLNNPQTCEDYGLSLSESELRAFPAGRKLLLEIRLLQRKRKQNNLFMAKMGKRVKQVREQIMFNILQ